jgi:transcriptional repressor NrdR
LVLKKNGRKQPFLKEKLMKGLQRAFEKRPIAFNEIKEIAEDIEQNIRTNYNFEIPSHEVGRITLDTIYKVDQVAYLRFASVYQTFNSIEEFKNLVNQLQDHKHKLHLTKEEFDQFF